MFTFKLIWDGQGIAENLSFIQAKELKKFYTAIGFSGGIQIVGKLKEQPKEQPKEESNEYG